MKNFQTNKSADVQNSYEQTRRDALRRLASRNVKVL